VDPTPAARAKLKVFQTAQRTLMTDLAEGMVLTERRQYPAAVAAYERVLARDPDNAIAHGRVGALYAAAGQNGRATEHLRAVARCDPNDAYGENMLGWLAYQDGKPEVAVEAFGRAEEMEPFSADLRYRWGLCLLQLARPAEAAERFRAALAVDPEHAGAHQGLSHALREQGKPTDAVAHARRAVRLTEEKNADVLVSLGSAYADARRFPEAELAFEKALDAARQDSPQLVPQINEQLAAVRRRAGTPRE
jgi:tetratricopeptide (TPR) repeat protein